MFIPASSQTHPSRRSRELAKRLDEAIADFRGHEPKVTVDEIDAALRSLQRSAGRSRKQRVFVALAAVTVAGLAGLVASASESARRSGRPLALAPIFAGVVVCIAIAGAVLLRLRSND